MKKISLIAAMAANRVIGRHNRLPWHLPADLKRFKRLTLGHTLIMGRKTFESIGRPLPGRSTVVVTRQTDYAPPGVQVAHSVQEALSLAEVEEVFIAGGAELFAETLPLADRLHLTLIEKDFEGDTFFPDFDPAEWRLVEEERHEPDETDAEVPYGYTFQIHDRRR
jgi:dihydrofolate reductase